MRLENKTAVITGSASGIGRATALLFAREGAFVVLNTRRNVAGASEVERKIRNAGGACVFVQGDVSDSCHARRIIAEALERTDRLDILVNNAAVEIDKPLVDTSEAEWDTVLDVNLKGAFLMSKFALPHMIQAGTGSVINVASAWGMVAGYNASAYCASKGGLINLSRSIALDYGMQGIRANSVCPGAIDTPILRDGIAQSADPEAEELLLDRAHPIGRIGQVEEVARAILWLASDEASFVTGSSLVVDGGLTAKCSQEGRDRWPRSEP